MSDASTAPAAPSAAASSSASASLTASPSAEETKNVAIAVRPPLDPLAVEKLADGFNLATNPVMEQLTGMLSELSWMQDQLLQALGGQRQDLNTHSLTELNTLAPTFAKLPQYQAKIQVLVKRLQSVKARAGKLKASTAGVRQKVAQEADKYDADLAAKHSQATAASATAAAAAAIATSSKPAKSTLSSAASSDRTAASAHRKRAASDDDEDTNELP